MFLDQKEEVLKVELTKHGRKLFGLGVFQPEYFYFFDNSIIYDSSYGGIQSEDVNLIQDRILDRSLTFSSLNNLHDILKYKLGTSDPLNDNAPAWSIKVLNGKIEFINANTYYAHRSFNVNNIEYNISFNKETSEVDVYGDYFLLDLKELNLSDDISNFEIELITYDELSGGKSGGLEKRLQFINKRTNIIDDMLYEEDELPSKFFDRNVSKEDVEYFFDVLVDDEIDTEYIVTTEKTIAEKIAGTYTSFTPPEIIKPPC